MAALNDHEEALHPTFRATYPLSAYCMLGILGILLAISSHRDGNNIKMVLKVY